MPSSSTCPEPMARGIVIVGAGECGSRAALALRDNGFDGPVTLIGAEAHVPYERPPLSKAVLCDAAPTLIADEARLVAAGIAHVCAEATAIDRKGHEVICGDRHFAYDSLLLATGARPRRLDAEGILYLRSMADCVGLRGRLGTATRLIVIGGGFLGLEIAASARTRGAEVTVLETQPRLLQRGVPPEIAEVIAARHAAAGVVVQCAVSIESVGSDHIRLADGRMHNADVVVAAVGAVPNTELAAAAGLATANGIVVDATLRTTDPDIFAAGDCCAFPLPVYDNRIVRLESWRSAGEQAFLAARNLLGANEPVSAVPWFWSDQYELTLQVAGLYEPSQTSVRRELGDGAFILFHLDGAGRLLAASGIGVGNAVARDIKLAEMLIARRAHPLPAELAEPGVKLKSLLAA
jgi:3-phenylpropionate/trans-cinnamate dioxygenase ferredoxin reductase component